MANNKRRYNELTKNTILFAISSFGTKVLSFLLVPLYTNILSTEEYGTADLLYTTTTLLIVVLTVNITEGLLVFVMDKNYSPTEVLAFGIKIIVLGWGLLVGVSCICYSMAIFEWPLYYYLFVILFFGVSALYQTFSNYLRGRERVNEVVIAGIVSSAVYLISNIIFLLGLNIGIQGYLLATILGPLAGFVYMLYVSNKEIICLLNSKISFEQKKAIIKYCTPLIFNSLALWINSCLDRYFVTYFCGVDSNGVYSVASKIPIILSTLYTIFSQAWTISAVKEFDAKDKDGFFSNTYEAYNAIMTISCAALVLLNIPLAKILYAKDFYCAWEYSSVLLLGVMFNSLTAFMGSIFSATKNSNILATTTVLSAITNTILNIILIPIWGVQGAAISTAIALGSMLVIRLIYIRRIIDIRFNWWRNSIVTLLLCVQIIAEHHRNHMYIVQILIFMTIVIIEIKPFIEMIKRVYAKIFH